MADKPLASAWLNAVGPQESLAVDKMDPATAEQCRMQLVKQHLLFKQQTAALHSAVNTQIQLANEIPVHIEEGGKAVQVWNPLEAVKAEITAAQALQGVLCTICIVLASNFPTKIHSLSRMLTVHIMDATSVLADQSCACFLLRIWQHCIYKTRCACSKRC